jgi:hypothetical protein
VLLAFVGDECRGSSWLPRRRPSPRPLPFAPVGFVAINEGLPHLVGDEALGEDRRLSVCCGHGGSAAAVHEEFCRSYLRRVRLCASIR